MIRLFCGHTDEIATILVIPLFQDLAPDNATLRIRIFWTGPFIADDRALFNKGMEATCRIDKFALYDAWEIVLYIPNDLNSQLHEVGL